MHTETLVDSDVADGRKLIDALQKAGVRIKAALWYFGTEMNEWRLMIQLPLSNEYHHRSAFEEIEKVRRTLGPQFHLPLRKIAVQSQHSPLVNTVRKKLEKNGGNREGFYYVGQRVPVKERVGIDFIEDVYVYFI
jgi:hypothetical protein